MKPLVPPPRYATDSAVGTLFAAMLIDDARALLRAGLVLDHVLLLYPPQQVTITILQTQFLALIADGQRQQSAVLALLDTVDAVMADHGLHWVDLAVAATNAHIPDYHDAAAVIATVGGRPVMNRGGGLLADERYFFLNMLIKLTAVYMNGEIAQVPLLPWVPGVAAACFADIVVSARVQREAVIGPTA